MIRHPVEQAAVKFDGLARASELLKHNSGIVDRLGIIVPQPDGAAVGRQRLFQSRLLLQKSSAIVKCFGVVRFQPDGRVESRQRRVGQTFVLQDRSEVVVGRGNAGRERDDLPICSLGPIQFMPVMQHGAEIELSFGVGWSQRHRVAVGRRRLVEQTLHLKQHADIVVGFRVIGFHSDGEAIRRHCLRELALLPERIAHREKCLGVVRLEPDRLAMRGDGLR
ncbi:MAG TPA: hypothetical protein VGM00_06060 [Bradyrhizobium sp.]